MFTKPDVRCTNVKVLGVARIDPAILIVASSRNHDTGELHSEARVITQSGLTFKLAIGPETVPEAVLVRSKDGPFLAEALLVGPEYEEAWDVGEKE